MTTMGNEEEAETDAELLDDLQETLKQSCLPACMRGVHAEGCLRGERQAKARAFMDAFVPSKGLIEQVLANKLNKAVDVLNPQVFAGEGIRQVTEEEEETDAELLEDEPGSTVSAPCLTGMRIAGLAPSGPSCSYVRQRGTEQECVKELWRVIEEKFVKDICPGGGMFVCCTLHLPLLLTDRFVAEYSLVRIRVRQ